jgi:microcin C transport system substrate-binding protein
MTSLLTSLPRMLAIAAWVIVAAAAGSETAEASGKERVHALSLVGEPRQPAGFAHFDWVDPKAPKGGSVRLSARGTFDTFNPFNIKGNKAAGLGLVYDALMTRSPDESSTEYCLVCEWVSYPADYSSVTFKLRPEARFSDGKPVTVEDVIFSLEALKKAHPQYALYYKNVVTGERTGEHEVTFRFDVKGNRELPHIVGELPVLPRHVWTGKNAEGAARDLAVTSLEAPLGVGPYRLKSFEVGRNIVFERIPGWWAENLPVARGMWNFNEIRFEYFREQIAAFEAFKAGQIDYFTETSAKQWATAYDFEAVRRGHVKKEAIDMQGRQQMQAFAMNIRRKQFLDPRVRRAIILAFDFEWANKNLFFDQYKRVTNYFGEPGLASSGVPTGKELEILEGVRGKVPPEVFTTPYVLPVNAAPNDARRHLALAAKLLAESGWVAKGGVLTNAAGETLSVEFLLDQPAFERVVQPYRAQLERLGIKATIRMVDSAQAQRREDEFDFDIIIDTFGQSASPGNEQREYWGSAAAAIKGSRNKIGIAEPAVDALIDRIIFAKDRAELEAATRALDRVLLWGHYVVPQWYVAADRVAYWDRFARPGKLPSRSVAFLQTWWHDGAKAKALAEARGRN